MTTTNKYRLEFELSGLPPTTNGSHGSWFRIAADRKKWRTAARLKATPAPPTPLTKARLICTRCSSVKADFDNLAISFKPLVDGLRDAGIIADDKDSILVERQYLHEVAKKNAGKVRIVVEEI